MKTQVRHEHQLPSAVLGLAVSAAGDTLYAACMDGGIWAVASETGERRRLGGHSNYASSVHVLPGRNVLVSGGYDGALKWHDVELDTCLRTVAAHTFWSWQTALSPNGALLASATGQYLAGGYKYEPAGGKESGVGIYDAQTGAPIRMLDHQPPVQAVAFSPDNRLVAAGNLMGGLRIWDAVTGEVRWEHTTDSFTGWGIIKGHYYTGGIYGMAFTPDGGELLVCGMGSTRDPAAGNGRQLWERYHWGDGLKTGEALESEIGRGLMETLTWHPSGRWFVMAGRLFNGKWNTAFFDGTTGSLTHAMDTKMRTTQARFHPDGSTLYLAGTVDQGKKKDGEYPEAGRIKVVTLEGD